MNETNPLPFSDPLIRDPVLHGVAQGLSRLFPPVNHPEGVVAAASASQATDAADDAS